MKEDILQLLKDGKSYKEICEILNCSKALVHYHARPDKREYFKEQRRKNRKKQMIELKLLKGGKCHKCGYDKYLEILDFHHIEASLKEDGVSKMFMTKGKAAAFKEAEKCILLCPNCHRELHLEERKSGI